MEINDNDLERIIKESIQKSLEIDELLERKLRIEEAIKRLDEGHDINLNEFLGGIRNIFNKGGNAAIQGAKALGQDFKDVGKMASQGIANKASQVYNSAKQQANNAAIKTTQAATAVKQGIGNAANTVKQTYIQGEKLQKLNDINKRMQIYKSKMQQLQQQYQSITGVNWNPQTHQRQINAIKNPTPQQAPQNQQPDSAAAE